jgi:hypothetical protein
MFCLYWVCSIGIFSIKFLQINKVIFVTIILCNIVTVVNTKLNLIYIKIRDKKVMMELVDMNSLGLFDF